MNMVILLTANADENEKMKEPVAANRNTFCLPQVSERNPQKCEKNTTPKKDDALINP